MNIFEVPQGKFTLNRYPLRKQETLRAWDAADEYLLQYLAQQDFLSEKKRLLILNDAFGGLTIPLSIYQPLNVSDSYISERAIVCNAELNHIKTANLHQLGSLDPLAGEYDLVLIKIPRSMAMLEYQLQQLRTCCSPSTVIIAAAMSKHIHTSTLNCFEQLIGPTRTSLAQKKARLVFSEFDADIKTAESRYPDSYVLDTSGERYMNHANVFSREKIDLGSRLLLQFIPQSDRYNNIVDLACGNGIIGIAAAKANPHAHLYFIDESYMAVESARLNVEHLLENQSLCEFLVTDCLQGIENESQDLILNNPPFHQQHTVGDFIAWQMFKESRDKLRQGGELIIVGNRHLGYHIKLRKLFGNCSVLGSNKKFVILQAIKQ